MKVTCYGYFSDQGATISLIKQVVSERKHEFGRTALVIFMMGYPWNVPNIGKALRWNGGGFVVILRPDRRTPPREFMIKGAFDVVNQPGDKDQTHQMFEEIEGRMRGITG